MAYSQEDMSDLARLQFVPEVGAKSVNVAGNVYNKAKDYVPESLKPQLSKVEESVVNISAPYVAYAQDKSTELLKVADTKVRRFNRFVQWTHIEPCSWQTN